MFAIHQRSNNHYLPLLSRGLKWDELQITPSLPRADGCWRTLVSLALMSSSATRKKKAKSLSFKIKKFFKTDFTIKINVTEQIMRPDHYLDAIFIKLTLSTDQEIAPANFRPADQRCHK